MKIKKTVARSRSRDKILLCIIFLRYRFGIRLQAGSDAGKSGASGGFILLLYRTGENGATDNAFEILVF